MFARVIELTVKADKKPDLIKKTKVEILSILNKQAGFVEILALESPIDLTKIMMLSFWHTTLDAERYQEDTFPKVKQVLEPFLAAPPVIKVFMVEETLSEKFTHMMAA